MSILRIYQNEIVKVADHIPSPFCDIFDFLSFNAVQSSCFNTLTQTQDNLVVSAPSEIFKISCFYVLLLFHQFSLMQLPLFDL